MRRYCLDANILIEPWGKHYSMELCPEYWDLLERLAQEDRIFCPMEVKREIEKIEDGLKDWVSARPYLFKEVDETVIAMLQRRVFKNPDHQRLVDSSNFRSVADPWVIAHALAEEAVVVTKEELELNPTKRIKIPNVCNALGIPWIDEFRFLQELGIRFTAKLDPRRHGHAED